MTELIRLLTSRQTKNVLQVSFFMFGNMSKRCII